MSVASEGIWLPISNSHQQANLHYSIRAAGMTRYPATGFANLISALLPTADIDFDGCDVRFVPLD